MRTSGPAGPAAWSAGPTRSDMSSFSGAERRVLAAALAADRPLVCPACGGAVSRQPVRRPENVAYVRRRVWLLCTACRRAGAVDLPAET